MIGYAMLGTNDYENALQFYDKVLAPVGGKRAMDFGTSTRSTPAISGISTATSFAPSMRPARSVGM